MPSRAWTKSSWGTQTFSWHRKSCTLTTSLGSISFHLQQTAFLKIPKPASPALLTSAPALLTPCCLLTEPAQMPTEPTAFRLSITLPETFQASKRAASSTSTSGRSHPQSQPDPTSLWSWRLLRKPFLQTLNTAGVRHCNTETGKPRSSNFSIVLT